jgi:hypothetical protein
MVIAVIRLPRPIGPRGKSRLMATSLIGRSRQVARATRRATFIGSLKTHVRMTRRVGQSCARPLGLPRSRTDNYTSRVGCSSRHAKNAEVCTDEHAYGYEPANTNVMHPKNLRSHLFIYKLNMHAKSIKYAISKFAQNIPASKALRQLSPRVRVAIHQCLRIILNSDS